MAMIYLDQPYSTQYSSNNGHIPKYQVFDFLVTSLITENKLITKHNLCCTYNTRYNIVRIESKTVTQKKNMNYMYHTAKLKNYTDVNIKRLIENVA